MITRLNSADPDFQAQLDQLLAFEDSTNAEIETTVRGIIDDVRARGDAAVLEYTARFDRNEAASMADLELPAARLQQALENSDPAAREGLELAAGRLRAYAEHQKMASWSYTEADGTLLGQQVTALDRVGLYVPGGKAAYPSPVLMNAVPAKVAGVPEIVRFSTFRDNLSRGSFEGVARVLEMDWIYGNATELVTFLQNHDVGPDNDFRFRYKGDQWMAAAAYNLLWTVRGIPCLYFGEEIEFMKGAPQDVIGNNDTLESTGRAYFGDYIDDEHIAQTQNHPLYRHIQRLNQIRRAVPALQKAYMSHLSEWGSGLSFVRDWSDGESYAVVGLTIGSGQDISVGGVRDGLYRDAVTGNEIRAQGGNLSFHVKDNSAGIYVLDGPGKIGEDGAYLR